MTLVRKGISRVHDLEGGNFPKTSPVPEGCRRDWYFRGRDAFGCLGRWLLRRLTPAGGGEAEQSAEAALPPTQLPNGALLSGRRGRCHSYRHSQPRRGRVRATSFPERRCSSPPASFGCETLRPPPQLSTCAPSLPAPSPPRALRRRGARRGSRGSPRGACAVRGPPLLWCRCRRRCSRYRLPAGKCGKEELRATAAVAAMGVSEGGRGDARAGRAPRLPGPLRPHCSLNPLSRDPQPPHDSTPPV